MTYIPYPPVHTKSRLPLTRPGTSSSWLIYWSEAGIRLSFRSKVRKVLWSESKTVRPEAVPTHFVP